MVFFPVVLYSQVGDICSTAYTVNLSDPLALPCDYQQISTSGLDFGLLNNNTATGSNPSCNYGTANNDVWLRVNIPANSDGFNLSINNAIGSSNDFQNFSAALYTGTSCSALTYVTCQRGSQLNYFRYFDGINPSSTVYIRIYSDNSPSGTFTDKFYIQMAAINTTNSNDICSKAKGLVANTYCNNTATGKNEPSSAAPDNLTGTNNVCGSSGFGTYENNQWYFFEVGPTTNQPVTVSLTGVNCTGTNSILQTALWKTTAFDCTKWASGYNLTNTTAAGDGNLIACAVGTGSVRITRTLPLGKYWFTVDGSRGSFCNYTINTSPAILPVYIIDFQAKNSKNGIEFTWTSLQTQDVGRFVIEGSQNGVDFQQEGEQIPKSAYGMASFQFYKQNSTVYYPAYYRLKSISKSGEVSYSKIIMVDQYEPSAQLKILYFDEQSRSVLVNSSFDKDFWANFHLINVSGQEISSGALRIIPGTNQFQLGTANISKGFYYLIVSSVLQIDSLKMMVTE